MYSTLRKPFFILLSLMQSKAEYGAEIVLGSLVERLHAMLRSTFIEQHISSERGFNEGLIDLLILLNQIQLMSNEAEKRQVSDDFLRVWLAELAYVVYDIDDVLGEFDYKILHKKVLGPSSSSNHTTNMANKIKIINESLNRLKDDIASFDLQVGFVNSIPESSLNKKIDFLFNDSEEVNHDNVEQITETVLQYELPENDCWSIFKKSAVSNERILTQDLAEIGREIAKKCRRVPWAARVLGGILYFKHDKNEWLSIQDNKVWDLLDDDNNGVFCILKLGFDHFPIPSLKRCFAYCAIFPKDYEMKKDELVQHWMAEGFLELSKENNMVMEDIGNMYFNILLITSFFQNARKDAYGNIISCKMHDLVHDFALSISKSETLILKGDSVDNINNVRHLFVQSDGKTTPRSSFSGDGSIKLRTLISENLDFDDLLSNFKCLRVLKLSGHSIKGLPYSIDQLIHLRLLHISDTKILKLPKSITKLYNLQTLRIEDCLSELPKDLSNLIMLRHIYIEYNPNCGDILQTPKNIGRLTCLQTLPIFVVGEDEGYWIEELGNLKNLRGKLEIYNLENVEDEEEAKRAKLKEKEIFMLGLYWEYPRAADYNNDEKVLEGLHPHPNLKSLTIECYRGKKFPSWFNDLSLFHNLICIKLGCVECEEVPTLGHLPCLRVLEMARMEVRSIGSEFYSYSDGSNRNTTTLFPSLRMLTLEQMYNLIEWEDAKELTGAGEVLTVFPCLEELILRECDKLSNLPDSLHACVSLQKLVVWYCNDLEYLPGVPSIIRCGINEPPNGLQPDTSPLQYLEMGSTSIQHSHPSLQKLQLYGSPLELTLDALLNLDQIQYFIALKILWIETFHAIESLPDWLGNLSSLQQLYIVDCENLVHLPTEEAMRRLTELKMLKIYDCPKLNIVQSKINHIPLVQISTQ